MGLLYPRGEQSPPGVGQSSRLGDTRLLVSHVAVTRKGAKLSAMFVGRSRSALSRSFSLWLVFVGLLTSLAACSGGVQAPVVTLPPSTAQPPSTTTTAVPPAQILTGDLADAVEVTPDDDLGTLVADAPENTTFVLTAGTHRMRSVEPKDGMSFIGTPGAVMSGAVVLGGFQRDGDFWRVDGIQLSAATGGSCVTGYDGCVFSEDLFMDNVMLWQVTDLADLDEGRWYWDGDSIYVANDPTTRRVELSVTPFAFLGGADDVTIQDLVIENYATPSQHGAIQAQELGDGDRGQNWLISNVEVSGAHAVGIRTGDGTRVSGVYVHHNGQLGISVSGGTDVLVEDSEIAYNNIAGFDWAWEGGGLKATRTDGLVVRSTLSHNNEGPGLWTDIDAADTRYEDNTVLDNAAAGIFHEISGSAVITGNTVEGNGHSKPEWLWGAGILIAASRDVEVSDNRVAGNADGIAGIQQERGDGPFGQRLLLNITVHDNVIEMDEGQTGVVDDSGKDEIFDDGNIVFNANTYVGVSGRRFAWHGRSLDKDAWMAVGQDTDSVWE